MSEVLLTLTLHAPDTRQQLAGPAMVKASPSMPVHRVLATFCRWLALPETAVTFVLDGQQIDASLTLQAAGFVNGTAVQAALLSGTPSAAACAAPFAMLDVNDSELSDLAGLMGMKS